MRTRHRKPKRGVRVLTIAIAAMTLASAAAAQEFPTRPIRVVVPYAPAGGSDITLRIVQPTASELLGQPLVLENRPGAGTLIGTQAVAAATPDGYTLGVMDPAFVINPTLEFSEALFAKFERGEREPQPDVLRLRAKV
jgi:tripartite-type tricarboxylate transporter receptor subunit TctC